MKGTFLAAIALVLLGLVLSGAVMLTAQNSAERIASGRPYCIQVPTDNGYRELSSVTQLSVLRMYSAGSPMHHAMMVLGDVHQPRLLHWSYRAMSFVDGAYGPPPIYCRPRLNYFDTLDQSAERDERTLLIVYDGYELRIPRSYRPSFTWPNANLLLTARAPIFEPTDGRHFEGNLATMLDVHFRTWGALEVWRNRSDEQYRIQHPDNAYRIDQLGSAFGLTKERLWYKHAKASRLQYYVLRQDGTVETLISCVSEDPQYQCAQSFEFGGMMYSFHHMPQDIPQWREMQARLVALFASFVHGERKWPVM